MSTKQFDVVVIGAGPGGYIAAIRTSEVGNAARLLGAATGLVGLAAVARLGLLHAAGLGVLLELGALGVLLGKLAQAGLALGAVLRLLLGDAARVDQALHEGVVGGDLGERVVAVEVDTRVADVREHPVARDQRHGGHRGAHAGELALAVGDRVEMLFVETGDRPRRDRFKVAGIYSSGMDEMDDAVIMTDLRNVQRLADWADGEISGYEIFTSDLAGADDFARRLGRALLYDDADDTANLAVSSVTELYPNIFDWLKAHDVNAAVIIGIMLVVAFFNMTSALLILVLERTRMIGLLKAFGMRNATLREVFLWRAAFVTLRGLAWGNAAGLAVCLVQKYFHVVKLSSEGYLLSEVPVALGWGWWLALNAGVVAAIVALLVVPACIVSTVKPDESIRYE